MEFGVVLPQVRATWDDVVRFGRRAEEAGFDSVWTIDHVYGFPPEMGILEPWTVMSALAVATERIRIGSQVLCQSFRNPALLAKMSTTLDHVSGGRLHFLIGTGWFEAEYTAFGYDFPRPGVRLAQLTDTVRICRGMWDSQGQPFTYDGRHYRVKEVLNLPPPERRIPLGIGGAGDRLLDLVAREADEWNCPAVMLGSYKERLGHLEERLSTHGRDVRRSVQIVFHPGEGEVPGRLQLFNPQAGLVGSPDRMTERAGELKGMGVEGLYGMVAGERGLEAMAEVLPRIRAALA